MAYETYMLTLRKVFTENSFLHSVRGKKTKTTQDELVYDLLKLSNALDDTSIKEDRIAVAGKIMACQTVGVLSEQEADLLLEALRK